MTAIPASSLEYLHIPVTGATDTMPVEIALVDRDVEPGDSDWHTAEWDGSDARILIGVGGSITRPVGVYSVWVRVTAAPERPVLKAGIVRIF